MAEPTAVIQVDGLTKAFNGVVAVDHLSLTVGRGEIFGLVGPDGAGKTTTLRMLAGILTPDEGTARVAGCDVARESEALKHRISYMPQRFGLYEDLSVDENIRFYADLFGLSRRVREPHVERLLAASGMGEFRRRRAGQLSGGMKQKLGLMCALIHTPAVLLLDEPTNGVDPVSRRDFWRILYSLVGEGVTIFISTSYLDEAERCHRLALIHRGTLLSCDTPAELKRRLPGEVLVVAAANPRVVHEALARAEGVTSIVLFGDGVHLIVDDAGRRGPEFEQRLRAAGASFDQIRRSVPTVEDLFVVSVQGREEQAP